MEKKKYEILDVTADIGILAYGEDIRAVFENAALGMFSLIVDPETIKVKETVNVIVESTNLEDLLVAWLNELLFIFETKEFIIKECRILEMDEKHLIAEIRGEHYNPAIHPRNVHIKAATYHNLEIKRYNSNWSARVIFDV
jgi:SHS2 domain-containing protein